MKQPGSYGDEDADVQPVLSSVPEGAEVVFEARHVGWVVDKSLVREQLDWGERRRVVLDAIREEQRRDAEIEAARDQFEFERGTAVEVDGKLLKAEQKELRRAQKEDSVVAQTGKTAVATETEKADGFQYTL